MAKKKKYNITTKRAERTLGENYLELLINHSSKHQASKRGYKHVHGSVYIPAWEKSIAPSEYRRRSKQAKKEGKHD